MLWEQIPNELKMAGLWCCWKLDSAKGKIPYDAKTGKMAKSNDKNTFHPFLTALSSLPKYQGFDEIGKTTGGLGLGIFNGFSGVDIDHCRDLETGKLSDMAQEIIDYCNSYTEISPSGEGIRIIFKTDFEMNAKTYYTNNAKIGLEVYISDATNKYVTITGNTIINSNIANVDIKYFMDKYMLKNATATTTVNKKIVKYDINISLAQALEKDTKLNTLWHGEAPGSESNENQLDLALCNKLAFYLKSDFDAINSAFMSSPYYLSKDDNHKQKWEIRTDYRERTIETAVKSVAANLSNKTIDQYALNDTGNAHFLIERYGHILKYNVDNEKWMIWNNRYWQSDTYRSVKTIVENVIEEMKQQAIMLNSETREFIMKNIKRALNSAGKEAMLREAQHIPGIPCVNNDFDKEKYLLNTKSGVFDLRTSEMFAHEKNMMLMKHSDYEADLKNEPELFMKFLKEIFEDDTELIDYMLKAFGYALTGSMKEQCIFFLVGDGSNGKSVLLQVLNEIAGDYAGSACSDLLLNKKFQSNNKSELAGLKGRRIIITTETNEGERLNMAQIKAMTAGNDEIVACWKYGNEFSYFPEYKIFMATNHLPVLRETDHGTWRRFRTIPFSRVFKAEEQDKDLIDKLREEYPRILGLLIRYAKKWYSEGLDPLPKKIIDMNSDFKQEMDLVQKWINECCNVGVEKRSLSSDLFSSFNEYCIENKEYQFSKTLWGRNFGKKFERRIVGGATYYIGIAPQKITLIDDTKKRRNEYE